MFVFGTDLYGKSDVAPGAFYVATRFFHFCWVPLVPLASLLVLVSERGKPTSTVRIPLSAKSMGRGWAVAASFLLGIPLTLLGIATTAGLAQVAAQTRLSEAWALPGLLLVMAGLWLRGGDLATPGRARELGAIASRAVRAAAGRIVY